MQTTTNDQAALSSTLRTMHELTTIVPGLGRQQDLLYQAALVVKQMHTRLPLLPNGAEGSNRVNAVLYTSEQIDKILINIDQEFQKLVRSLEGCHIAAVIASAICKHYKAIYRRKWLALRRAVVKAAPQAANIYSTATRPQAVYEDANFVIISLHKSYPVQTLANKMIALWNEHWSKIKLDYVHSIGAGWYIAINARNVMKLMYGKNLVEIATIHMKEA